MRKRMHNDHRAAHEVYVFEDELYGGTAVRFPYRDCWISLAMDGSDTIAWLKEDEDEMVVDYNVILGTSGESIKSVMEIIDTRYDIKWKDIDNG